MTLQPGVMINQNVRLVRVLGKGGMGAVWLADHLTLSTQVAVKFILGDYAGDQEALHRFTREATAAARMKSPNVVQVFDHGVFAGLPYIVMELLEGEDLDARIARGPLSLGEVAPILHQVGKALTVAHGLGIIHRDIKPANVFLTHVAGELLVKLLDFGVAKTTAPGDDARYKKTQTGQIVGTPCFMSPEQIFSGGSIDHRVDLWALAVLAYEAITGTLPFAGNTLGDIYVAINQGSYVPPRSVCPAFPAEIDAFFARAFARAPAARFSSAREICDAFSAVAARAPHAQRTGGSAVGEAITGMEGTTAPLQRPGTLGGTSSSKNNTRAARGKLAIAAGAIVVSAGVGALAFGLVGRGEHVYPTPATSSVAVSADPPAPAIPTIASAPAPMVTPASALGAAPTAASAAPSASAPAPVPKLPTSRPLPSAQPRPPAPPVNGHDHGF